MRIRDRSPSMDGIVLLAVMQRAWGFLPRQSIGGMEVAEKVAHTFAVWLLLRLNELMIGIIATIRSRISEPRQLIT